MGFIIKEDLLMTLCSANEAGEEEQSFKDIIFFLYVPLLQRRICEVGLLPKVKDIDLERQTIGCCLIWNWRWSFPQPEESELSQHL